MKQQSQSKTQAKNKILPDFIEKRGNWFYDTNRDKYLHESFVISYAKRLYGDIMAEKKGGSLKNRVTPEIYRYIKNGLPNTNLPGAPF